MISYIPKEKVEEHWPIWFSVLAKFWHKTIHFETQENLLGRLMEDKAQLFLWTGEEGKYLFVTETKYSATAKIMQVTHTGSFGTEDETWSRGKIKEVMNKVFDEITVLAKDLGFDVLGVSARPGHVKLADGFTVQSTNIIKRL